MSEKTPIDDLSAEEFAKWEYHQEAVVDEWDGGSVIRVIATSPEGQRWEWYERMENGKYYTQVKSRFGARRLDELSS